jgi:hypothetical protein
MTDDQFATIMGSQAILNAETKMLLHLIEGQLQASPLFDRELFRAIVQKLRSEYLKKWIEDQNFSDSPLGALVLEKIDFQKRSLGFPETY